MSKKTNELLPAIKNLLDAWDTMPFHNADKSGTTVCIEKVLWRRFNYDQIGTLRDALEKQDGEKEIREFK